MSVGQGCLPNRAWPGGTVERTWDSLGMGEPRLTDYHGGFFRTWVFRIAVTTWMWVSFPLSSSRDKLFLCPMLENGVIPPLASSQVCPRRPEGKVLWIPREEARSGKKVGNS